MGFNDSASKIFSYVQSSVSAFAKFTYLNHYSVSFRTNQSYQHSPDLIIATSGDTLLSCAVLHLLKYSSRYLSQHDFSLINQSVFMIPKLKTKKWHYFFYFIKITRHSIWEFPFSRLKIDEIHGVMQMNKGPAAMIQNWNFPTSLTHVSRTNKPVRQPWTMPNTWCYPPFSLGGNDMAHKWNVIGNTKHHLW